MKKIVLLISFAVMALFASSTVSAQGKYGADSVECIKYLSYYTEYYKQKNYASAMPNWRQAYKYCPPSSRYNLLSNGTTLIKDQIKKKLVGKGGAVAYFGTNDIREISARAEAGEEACATFLKGFCVSVAKYVGALATVVGGKVDAIILTGRIAHSKAKHRYSCYSHAYCC